MIRDARTDDAEAIASIYNYYVVHTPVTFEEEPVKASQMAVRLDDVVSSSLPWIVLEQDSIIVGNAYATKWKARSAYRFSVESTVYLAQHAVGQGLGTHLYHALIDRLRSLGINTVVGGITLPNPASVALHEKIGMRKVAQFERIGYKFSVWRDVGYWQMCLK